MKKILKLTTIAVASVVTYGLASGGPAAADSITAVSWGGAYTQSQLKAYHGPFTEKTGIVVNSEDYNGGLAEIKAQVEAGNITWDVVDLELSDVVQGCDEGILEEIDSSILPPAPDGTPAVDDFINGALHECAVGTIVWSTIYAYDATKYPGAKPTSMADFFDTAKFPGKRAVRRSPKPILEMALMGDGVDPGDVYNLMSTKEGVDRAFAKLDTIKDDLLFWEAGAQPPQMLADGEVAMATAYNGRIFNAQNLEKKPFVIVWDGQIWDLDLWAIPKGAKNMKNILEFIKFSTDTQRLADQAKYISYGPVRKSSIPLVSTHAETGIDMGPHMPTSANNFKRALQNDFGWWADHRDEMEQRFAAWLAK